MIASRSADAGAQAAPYPAHVTAPATSPPETDVVLIVERDVVVCTELCAGLAAHGYEVLRTQDIAEAMDLAQRSDAVICDIHPPAESLGFVCWLREDELLRWLPIMMLARQARPGQLSAAMSAGVDDYIRVPFDLDEVTARVTRSLALARLRQDALDEAEACAVSFQDESKANRWINIAIGVVMGRLGIGADDAAARLHVISRSTERPLIDVAQSVATKGTHLLSLPLQSSVPIRDLPPLGSDRGRQQLVLTPTTAVKLPQPTTDTTTTGG
jgi:CheY-like chemotaxis protein